MRQQGPRNSYCTSEMLVGSVKAAGLNLVAQQGSPTIYPLAPFAKNGLRSETLCSVVFKGSVVLSPSKLQFSFSLSDIELVCAKRAA